MLYSQTQYNVVTIRQGTVLYNQTQYNVVQSDTVQCLQSDKVQCCTIRHSTMLYSQTQYNVVTIRQGTMLYNQTQYNIVQSDTVQYCTIGHSTMLHNHALKIITELLSKTTHQVVICCWCQIFTQVLLMLLTFWRLAFVWILFKYSSSASQKTHCSLITNIRQSVLFQKMMQNYLQHTNAMCTTCRLLKC